MHLELIEACLAKRETSYTKQLRNGERTGKLIVLHDLGLDPQSDDWIAIRIVTQLW